MRASRQEPFLDQVPHQQRGQANQENTQQQKNSRIECGEPKYNHDLQYRPMHNIDAIGEISIFRKVTQKAPEPKNEDDPGNPDNIQNASREPMVNEIQASRDAQNTDRKSTRLN